MKHFGSKVLRTFLFAIALVLLTTAAAENVGDIQPAEMKVLKGTASSDDIALIQTKNGSGIEFSPGSDPKVVVNIICNIPDSVDTSKVDMFFPIANMKAPLWTENKVKIKIRNFNTGKWQTVKVTNWKNADDANEGTWTKLKRKYKNFESFDDFVNTEGNVLLRVNSSNNEGGFAIDNIRLVLATEIF